ncbi:MAG: DUF3298 domain-containing protein [Rhizomicrobium sp.]
MPFRAVLLALMLLVPLGASAAGLPVAKKTLAFTSKAMDISVAYPQTGNKAIDGTILDYARKSVATFKAFEPDLSAGDHPYALDTRFEVVRNDGRMFAVLFTEYADTGGAHPNTDYHTFNFLLPDGAEVFLPEIVNGPRGLKRISDLAGAYLLKTIGTGPDSLSDSDTIKSGTAPGAYSFRNFAIAADRLHIYFPPYQVAAYAAGPQEAVIPLAALKDVLRRDWRAPAASFDCGKAATTIEHAICADAALARLDRQTAEAYQYAVANAYGAPAKEAVRQVQRDWIARRNAACSGPSPGACLVKSYRDRIAVLTKP